MNEEPEVHYCKCPNYNGKVGTIEANRSTVKKAGPNTGRSFWACKTNKDHGGCGYFAWETPQTVCDKGYPGGNQTGKRARVEERPASENTSGPRFSNGLPFSQGLQTDGSDNEENSSTVSGRQKSRTSNDSEYSQSPTPEESGRSKYQSFPPLSEQKPTNPVSLNAVRTYDQTVIQMMKKLRNDLNELEQTYLHHLALNNIPLH